MTGSRLVGRSVSGDETGEERHEKSSVAEGTGVDVTSA